MLRGQASLQDIIGKPQSWRSGKARQKNKKSIFPAGDEALEVVIKEEGAHDVSVPERQGGSAPAANKVLREGHCSQETLALPSPGHSGPGRAASLRCSPRKAQAVGQHSAGHDCPLHCPVCNKTMPASMIEINRHIGERDTTYAFS